MWQMSVGGGSVAQAETGSPQTCLQSHERVGEAEIISQREQWWLLSRMR